VVKPSVEVADVFREYGQGYRSTHGALMSSGQHRVMSDITRCRTSALGGHLDKCDTCGREVNSYNSCRNRHCPKCGSLAKAKWLDARRDQLLPVGYYHVVFTVPHLLAPLALANKRVFYDILFQCASRTMLTIAKDPKHLGARIGLLAVLHTWDQKLLYHPHLHCVVPGGGISFDSRKWIACRPDFFLPVRVLSRLFRRLFLGTLLEGYTQGLLQFHGAVAHLATKQAFHELLAECRQSEWVVYCKRPFGGPEKVLDYLGRYTHRVAISNHRLLSIDDGNVTFTYRDRKNDDVQKTMTLPADEFIGRFLLHVLPDRFVRIRQYGLLANRNCKHKIALCRTLLGVHQDQHSEVLPKSDWVQMLIRLTGSDPLCCPHCRRGQLKRVQTIPPKNFSPTRPPP